MSNFSLSYNNIPSEINDMIDQSVNRWFGRGHLMQTPNLETQETIIPNWLFSEPESNVVPFGYNAMVMGLRRHQVQVPASRVFMSELEGDGTESDDEVPDLTPETWEIQGFAVMLQPMMNREDTFTPQWVTWAFDTESSSNHRPDYFAGAYVCCCSYCVKKRIPKFEILEKLIHNKSRNNECPITYRPIKENDMYLCCRQCQYNFSEYAIMKYWTSKPSGQPNCPMCRTIWTDQYKYVNTIPKNDIVKELVAISSVEPIKKLNKNKKLDSLLKETNKKSEPKLTKTKNNKKWFYGK